MLTRDEAKEREEFSRLEKGLVVKIIKQVRAKLKFRGAEIPSRLYFYVGLEIRPQVLKFLSQSPSVEEISAMIDSTSSGIADQLADESFLQRLIDRIGWNDETQTPRASRYLLDWIRQKSTENLQFFDDLIVEINKKANNPPETDTTT